MQGKKRFIAYAVMETVRFLLIASFARGGGFMSGPYAFLYLSLASASLVFPLCSILLLIDPERYTATRVPLGIAKILQAVPTFVFLLASLRSMASSFVPGMAPYLEFAALASFITFTDGMGIRVFLSGSTVHQNLVTDMDGPTETLPRGTAADEITTVEDRS